MLANLGVEQSHICILHVQVAQLLRDLEFGLKITRKIAAVDAFDSNHPSLLSLEINEEELAHV